MDAPIKKEPKSPALWESGIATEGVVPSWPKNGLSLDMFPTISWVQSLLLILNRIIWYTHISLAFWQQHRQLLI